MASSQKRISLGTCGLARPVSHDATKNAHAPSVTSWKTPTTSSVVEWSTCSSSRSYSPKSLAATTQSGSASSSTANWTQGSEPLPAETISFAKQIREDQAGSVGGEQSPSHEPAAAARRMLTGGAASPLEQRFRPPVEHEHVEVEPRRGSLLEDAHALRLSTGAV